MSRPVYDDPNHQHYGPVRRMWVILAGLGLLEFEDDFKHEWGWAWDEKLAYYVAAGVPESLAKRTVIGKFLDMIALAERR